MLDDAAARFDAGAFLKTVPSRAGVYRMVDRHHRVLYVGKARNLRRRLASWLRGGGRDEKGRALLSRTAAVEVTVTHTETEALLLENNLIKSTGRATTSSCGTTRAIRGSTSRSRPPFPASSFTADRGARRAGTSDPSRAPGRCVRPSRSSTSCSASANARTRSSAIAPDPASSTKIDRCSGPCVDSSSGAGYAEDVRHATMFLEGRSETMIEELVERMEAASRRLDFELAARYRDQISGLRRVQERQYVDGARGDIDVVAVCRGGRDRGRPDHGDPQRPEPREPQPPAAQSPGRDRGGHPRSLPRAVLPVRRSVHPPPYRARPSSGGARATRRGGLHAARAARSRSAWGSGGTGRIGWRWRGRTAEVALNQRLADQSTLDDRLAALAEALELPEPPARIECFDVSHTDGEATVASCVVFGPEGPVKSDYRRFNIAA